MTRYCLQHRETGDVWPLPEPQGFGSATEAVLWAALHAVPTTYRPYPFTEKSEDAKR